MRRKTKSNFGSTFLIPHERSNKKKLKANPLLLVSDLLQLLPHHTRPNLNRRPKPVFSRLRDYADHISILWSISLEVEVCEKYKSLEQFCSVDSFWKTSGLTITVIISRKKPLEVINLKCTGHECSFKHLTYFKQKLILNFATCKASGVVSMKVFQVKLVSPVSQQLNESYPNNCWNVPETLIQMASLDL